MELQNNQNEKHESAHQLLANELSPDYIVYDLNGGIGVAKGDLEPLDTSDIALVTNTMRRLGIRVRNVVRSDAIDTFEEGSKFADGK